MDSAIAELNSREFRGRIPYKEIAKKHGVVDTTLRRRHRAETETVEVQHLRQQLLTPEQEVELIRYINQETKGKQPPGRFLVRDKAALLAGKPVGQNWVYRFLQRHADVLVYKKAAPIDC